MQPDWLNSYITQPKESIKSTVDILSTYCSIDVNKGAERWYISMDFSCFEETIEVRLRESERSAKACLQSVKRAYGALKGWEILYGYKDAECETVKYKSLLLVAIIEKFTKSIDDKFEDWGYGRPLEEQQQFGDRSASPKPQELPEEVKAVFEKAIDKKLMSRNGAGYTWNTQAVLLAYFIEKLYIKDDTSVFPNELMQRLFNRKGLKQLCYNYHGNKLGKPRQHKIIDELFD